MASSPSGRGRRMSRRRRPGRGARRLAESRRPCGRSRQRGAPSGICATCHCQVAERSRAGKRAWPHRGTTCTAASRTSSRNRFSVEPLRGSPSGARRLAEITWVIPSRFAKAMSPSAGRSALHSNDRCAQLLGKADVVLQRLRSADLIGRALPEVSHVDCVPKSAQPPGDACSHAKETGCVGA